MDQQNGTSSRQPSDAVAYLVIREGSTWRDVFRLQPGQVTTVGRAPTNRIVIRDDVCSRNHCEVFLSGARWTLRDLGSRNGTRVNGIRIKDDWALSEGEVIQIGPCHLGFTYDITAPFQRFEEQTSFERPTDPEMDAVLDGSGEIEPAIIHRARNHRYRSSGTTEVVGRDRTAQELAKLYRIGLDMGAAGNASELSNVVLEALFSETSADIGAILLLTHGATTTPAQEQLNVFAYKSQGELPYEKVSDYLSSVVIEDREAVLARDVADDSGLSRDDMLDELHAKSVICAPIRMGETIHGLIHLYCTHHGHPLKPDDLEFTLAVADQLAVSLENLKQKETLEVGLARVRDENRNLRRQLDIEGELVGDSPVMQQLRESIARIAPTDATALIRGESGVGKELVARAIHFNSNRRDGAFVTMNCAALSESLLESELFGHEKGSFTGATGRKIGKFEQANNGTLFLDEVGEMSATIQAKFLRALEGHPFERVGGRDTVQVDVRVVAATNRDLEEAVEAGTFRKDLYFRLHVVQINVEPLRDRPTDIALLADHFLERFARKTNRPVKRFSRDALEALLNYRWPGNVRELQHTVERAVILCSGELVTADDIQLSTLGMPEPRAAEQGSGTGFRDVSLDVLEQEHILAVLDRTNWNKTQAAQILGIERSTLDRKLKRYRVNRPGR